MKLPLVTPVDSRDGSSNKDERMTNMLAETDEGVTLATVRPGLTSVVAASGNGNGLVNFEGVLFSVFGATLGKGTGPTTIATVTNGFTDFAQSPL